MLNSKISLSGRKPEQKGQNVVNEKLFLLLITFTPRSRGGVWLRRAECRQVLNQQLHIGKLQAKNILSSFKNAGLLEECSFGYRPTDYAMRKVQA